MTKLSCYAFGLILLAGCASTGGGDGTHRIVGVVEGSTTVHELLKPSLVDGAAGVVGGAIGAALSVRVRDANSQVNQLFVKTVDGKIITAHTKEDFADGTCVEIVPKRNVPISEYYAYGQARIVSSDSCRSH